MPWWSRSARVTEPTETPLDGVSLVMADLDGVVYKGPGAIPHAVDALIRSGETHRVAYITNNAARTAASVAEHLSGFGLPVTADDVVTSPQAAVKLLLGIVPAGSLIFVVGGEGLVDELEKAGFRVTRSADDGPDAVVQGFHPSVGWEQLAEASYALHTGIPWVATNTDWSIPQARGIAPGNGTLVAAVHSAVARLPVFAGKPEVPIFEAAFERFGTREALFIGDRLDTDILGARRAGIPSALVLTGIDQAKQVLAAKEDERPTFILGDLRELHEPYPATERTVGRDGAHTITVRGATVRLAGHVLSIVEAGDDRTDLLRAGAAAIWESGLQIYGLDVAEGLYS